MKLANIDSAKEWFEVLETTERSQTAMMTLEPGGETGSKPNSHDKSDQILLVLEGELTGQVGDGRPSLKKHDVIIIPAGTKHRFENKGSAPAITFNVYSPPAYPPGTKG